MRVSLARRLQPLYLIGLGLGDEKDVTVKGAEAIAKCTKVFLEAYTSVLGVDKAALVRGRPAVHSRWRIPTYTFGFVLLPAPLCVEGACLPAQGAPAVRPNSKSLQDAVNVSVLARECAGVCTCGGGVCGGVWLVQEALYGKPIVTAERETVESTAETDILTPALTEDVALLVVGDALW